MKRRMMGGRSAAMFTCMVAIMFVAVGCSSNRSSGVYDNELPADEEMAAESSIYQFEGTGEVAAGGVFQDVSFAFDSDGLGSVAMEAVRNNVALMEANSALKVEIEGHCDERGTVEYNLSLGEKRANAVKDYLTGLGINDSRISVLSYGKERPVDNGHDETAWGKNRRAEFKIISQ